MTGVQTCALPIYELGGKVPTWAAEFHLPWIQTLGISIHLAVDGLSLLMVLLTALLGVLAVGCSWGEIQKNVGFFHLNLLHMITFEYTHILK